MAPTLTVLMTVYEATTAEELVRSIECIEGQTRPPEEFLVVVDGPLSADTDAVLEQRARQATRVRVERLRENVGSGAASAHGVRLARGELLARHDSDDISVPWRFERQVEAMRSRDLDIVGSAMYEFSGDPENVIGVRRAPSGERAIRKRARINNPFNHPTIMFRRSLALEVGNYHNLRFVEDYDLLVRMLQSGARADNLAEPLVLFNAGQGMLGRRRGIHMLKWEYEMQRRLLQYGTIGPAAFVRNIVVRGALRLAPTTILGPLYSRMFRTRAPAVAASRHDTQGW